MLLASDYPIARTFAPATAEDIDFIAREDKVRKDAKDARQLRDAEESDEAVFTADEEEVEAAPRRPARRIQCDDE